MAFEVFAWKVKLRRKYIICIIFEQFHAYVVVYSVRTNLSMNIKNISIYGIIKFYTSLPIFYHLSHTLYKLVLTYFAMGHPGYGNVGMSGVGGIVIFLNSQTLNPSIDHINLHPPSFTSEIIGFEP